MSRPAPHFGMETKDNKMSDYYWVSLLGGEDTSWLLAEHDGRGNLKLIGSGRIMPLGDVVIGQRIAIPKTGYEVSVEDEEQGDVWCCASGGSLDRDGVECHSPGCPLVNWYVDPPRLKEPANVR